MKKISVFLILIISIIVYGQVCNSTKLIVGQNNEISVNLCPPDKSLFYKLSVGAYYSDVKKVTVFAYYINGSSASVQVTLRDYYSTSNYLSATVVGNATFSVWSNATYVIFSIGGNSYAYLVQSWNAAVPQPPNFSLLAVFLPLALTIGVGIRYGMRITGFTMMLAGVTAPIIATNLGVQATPPLIFASSLMVFAGIFIIILNREKE